MGQAHVGDYKVQSHTGSEFTHDELHGEFGLIYFGQSSHPDTVSELERLAEVVSNSGAPSLLLTHHDNQQLQGLALHIQLGLTGAHTPKLCQVCSFTKNTYLLFLHTAGSQTWLVIKGHTLTHTLPRA